MRKKKTGHIVECSKCGREINSIGFARHAKFCDGSGKQGYQRKYSQNEDGTITCPICFENFPKTLVGIHIFRVHDNGKIISWNKGKTKETDERLARASKKMIGRPSVMKGKTITKDHKDKVSAGMKKAHSEGRGWHIGKARNERKPSYPEQFFMRVIENEFEDKNYQREVRVSKYAIDFAWVDKKIAIEVDGQFHRLPEYVERDKRKDEYLKENGWKVLRLPWIEVFADPKKWIEKAKIHVH